MTFPVVDLPQSLQETLKIPGRGDASAVFVASAFVPGQLKELKMLEEARHVSSELYQVHIHFNHPCRSFEPYITTLASHGL